MKGIIDHGYKNVELIVIDQVREGDFEGLRKAKGSFLATPNDVFYSPGGTQLC